MSLPAISGAFLHLVATLDNEESKTILLALHEATLVALGQRPTEPAAGAIERLNALHARSMQDWKARREYWVTHGDTHAHRRDGVNLDRGYPRFFTKSEELSLVAQVSRSFWTVQFPPYDGDAAPVFTVEGLTLAEATAAVDARWPMATWWGSIDAQARAQTCDQRWSQWSQG